jgi:predicted DNA-binding transcriptional regulator AlpA
VHKYGTLQATVSAPRLAHDALSPPAARERKPKVMLMPDPMAGLPPRLLRTPDAARFLGISNRTLEKHRTYGTGPVYRKIGGRVVYAVEDLQAWSATGARKSTTDQTVQRVFPARRLTAAERGARAE